MLSQRLAALELLDLGTAEVSEIVADEARQVVGSGRAVVWLYQPSIDRLFVEQRGREIRSVDLSQEELPLFSAVETWTTDIAGLRRSLAELSFGFAAHGGHPPAIAIPLSGGGGPIGLILIELGEDSPAPAPSDLEMFGRQAATILANHQALLRTRRHEEQLEALHQTAAEVSANLDLQPVLDAIVERAHTLIDAPVAYVTLNDPTLDEMYMRATVGVTSREFRTIRLRVGSGLGGASAESDRPVYTSDYLNDERFQHTTSVDAAVRGERIKSILGVPLRASEVLVGVLYVADRTERMFDQSHVQILETLARHAAVAINNAGLYQRATDALAQISRINQVAEQQNRLLRESEEIHRRLSEVVLSGDGLQRMTEVLSSIVGSHVVIVDDHGQVRSSAGTPADAFGSSLAADGLKATRGGDEALTQALQSVATFNTGILESDGKHRLRPRLVVPVVARGEVLGSVWTEIGPDEARARRGMEEGSRVIALELLKESSIDEVERRIGRELLEGLLSERPLPSATLERRGYELGLSLSKPHHLGVLAADMDTAGGRRTREEIARRLAPLPGVAFVAEHGGRLVVLLDDLDAERTRRLAQTIERVQGATLVVGGPCATPADHRANFVAADRALALLGAELREPIIHLDDLRVIALLFGGEREVELREFVDHCLGPLVRADQRPGRALLQTLEAYLESGGNAARTASVLFVHVNTVYYRLDQLREILGDALENPRKVLDLQVALLARRLIDVPLDNPSNRSPEMS